MEFVFSYRPSRLPGKKKKQFPNPFVDNAGITFAVEKLLLHVDKLVVMHF